MAAPQPPPAKRLRTKGPAQVATPQTDVQALDHALFVEDNTSKRQVYLVTAPHPTQTHSATGKPLLLPSDYSHQDLLAAVLDAAANPMYGVGNNGRGFGSIRLVRCLVAAEYHRQTLTSPVRRHYHVAVCGWV